MAEPFVLGATQATVRAPFPFVPDTPVGAPGTAAGTDAVDGEATPSPFAFTALI